MVILGCASKAKQSPVYAPIIVDEARRQSAPHGTGAYHSQHARSVRDTGVMVRGPRVLRA